MLDTNSVTGEKNASPPRYSDAWFKTLEGVTWSNDAFVNALIVVLRDHIDEVEDEYHEIPPGSTLRTLVDVIIGLRDPLIAWAENSKS